MNNELNVKIEEMMADFQKRQSEIINELDNLKKSTSVLEDNVISEFKIVREALFDDLKTVYDTFKTIKNSNTRVDSEFEHFDFFSIFDSTKINSNAILYVWTHPNRKDVNLSIGGLEVIFDHNELYCSGCNKRININDLTNSEKEHLVRFYRTGLLTEMVIKCLSEHLKHSITDYQKELERQKRILENAEPIVQNDTHWSDYIMYLLKWSSEHADKEFAGMSPACYDEWLDNEQGE